jgi:hypothetical protein
MKKSFIALLVGLVLTNYELANAMTSSEYAFLEESFSLVLLLACLVVALLIFKELRGGNLGLPWVLIAAGFALGWAASLIHILDLHSILFGDYDLRPIHLVIRASAALFTLIGLVFYKKGLQ